MAPSLSMLRSPTPKRQIVSIMRWILPLFALPLLAACGSTNDGASPSLGMAAGSAVFAQPAATFAPDENYRLGPTDLLRIATFQVPDLSFEEIRVDAAGNIDMPLIGTLRAAGLTPGELADEMERRLAVRYLRNPQVNVTVSQAASQKVTVDGAVTKPGVYEMRGRTTLVQAIAMAEGPTRVADLEHVVVFRTVEGRRMAAVFDLKSIRAGEMSDPFLNGDDIVVVDTSRTSQMIREVLAALPGLAVFGYF